MKLIFWEMVVENENLYKITMLIMKIFIQLRIINALIQFFFVIEQGWSLLFDVF